MNKRIGLIKKIAVWTYILEIVLLFVAFLDSQKNNNSYFSHLETLIVIIFLTFFYVVSSILAVILFKRDKNKIIPSSIFSVNIFILLVFVTAILSSELDRDIIVQTGYVTHYGVFDIPEDKGTDRILYDQRKLSLETTDIPMRMGTRFGFNYIIVGNPTGEVIKLKQILKYPEQGMIYKKGTVVYADTSYHNIKLGSLNYTGFEFEYSYELVPGVWEFELLYEGKELCRQSFMLYN